MSSGAWITLIVIVLILLFLAYWFRRRQSQSTNQQRSLSSSSGVSTPAAGTTGSTRPSASEGLFGLASSGTAGDSGGERTAGTAAQGFGLTSNAEAESDSLASAANALDSSADLLEGTESIEPAPPSIGSDNDSGAGNAAPAASYGIAAQPALAAAEEARTAAATGTPEGQELSDAISQRMYLGSQPDEGGGSASSDSGNAAATSVLAASEHSSSANSGGGSTASVSGAATSEARMSGDGYVTMDGQVDECPVAYPIKGNASSHIYHQPGESSYEVAIPEICFADVTTAEAMGFRARRSGAPAGSHSESRAASSGSSSTTAAASAYGVASRDASHSAAETESSPPTGSASASDSTAFSAGESASDANSSANSASDSASAYGIANTPSDPAASSASTSAGSVSSGSGRTRRAPGQGYVSMEDKVHDCPSSYPIKGNESSRIFHRPGESSYERTIPEICFADERIAVSMGFRERAR